jgi:rhamnosyltransferase
MISDNVCAVVVTFHPDHDVLENLSKLRQEIPNVVVVDNGSTVESINPLRDTTSRLGFHLVENGENLGIATALNLGVRYAETIGAKWVLLFDQDSAVTPGFLEAMLLGFESSRWGKDLAILGPRYVDKRSGSPIPAKLVGGESVEVATTSGSLLPMWVFRGHGYFVDDLFIDGVDYEYSLRLRSRGYRIGECSEAVLLHSPGSPTALTFRGHHILQTTNYSPLRRYYQERNKVWVSRRYWNKFPRFCLWLFFSVGAKDYVKILLAEDNKWEKLRACLIGAADGVRERMGRKDRL